MNGTRNLNIDLLKTIAMLGVICLHTTRNFAEADSNIVSVASVMYRTAVFAIPTFFIVNGYLLCARDYVNYKYVISKILRIFRYILIFCGAYWLLHIHQYGLNIKSLAIIIYNACHGFGPFYVFWYFGSYSLLLVLLPFIVKLYHRPYYFYLATTFSLLMQNIVFLHNLTNGGGQEDLCTTYRIYNWLTYFMIGGVLRRTNFKFKHIWPLIVMLILNLYNQFSLYDAVKSTAASFYYSSIVTIALVISLSATIFTIRINSNNKLIKETSNLFLPVFTIHSFFLNPVMERASLFGCLAPVIAFLTVSLLALGTSWCFMKIPGIKKIITI